MSRYQARRVRDLTDVDEHALRCHYYRQHAFGLPVFVPTWFEGERKALRADVKCECGTRKVIVISAATFEVWSTWYDHPDHYLIEGGRPDKAEATRELERRTTSAARKAAGRAQKAADAAEEKRRNNVRHIGTAQSA